LDKNQNFQTTFTEILPHFIKVYTGFHSDTKLLEGGQTQPPHSISYYFVKNTH